MSKNNTRYEIDVLLQMARITEDAHKKKEYLCTIETLLNCAEVPSEPTYGYSVNVDNSVIEFCDNKQIAGIIGDEIMIYCVSTGLWIRLSAFLNYSPSSCFPCESGKPAGPQRTEFPSPSPPAPASRQRSPPFLEAADESS